MLNRLIFKFGYFVKRPQVLNYYNSFQKSQWQSFEWLENNQEKQLKKLIHFVYENVPYYSTLFRKLDIKPNEITYIKNLEKLPILTKKIIKEDWQNFIPKNIDKLKYLNGSTGGSTGTPFKYRISREDYERGIALLYRGWGYGGYKLGDKVAIIAGSSLIPAKKSTLKKKIQELFLNHRFYSSFDMGEKNLYKYFFEINRWKPDYIRGYASSIYLFAKFIQENNLKLEFKPKAIFTTAEKLFDNQRIIIEKVFNVKVFNEYGVNDGGVSVHECEKHNGMHVDMERAVLEVVDNNGKQIIEKEGKIFATSLYNYTLPFIRYDTGDLGIISNSKCACRRNTPLLKNIIGRVSDFIFTGSGLKIHGEFFTHLFYDINNVSQFQVVQNKLDEILIRIVPDNWLEKEKIDTEKIKNIIKTKGLKVEFQFVQTSDLAYTKAGKYKFIINNIKDNF